MKHYEADSSLLSQHKHLQVPEVALVSSHSMSIKGSMDPEATAGRLEMLGAQRGEPWDLGFPRIVLRCCEDFLGM